MMFNVAKWFTGLTIIQLKENFVPILGAIYSEIDTCPVYGNYAACVWLSDPITGIPKDFGPAIEIMNISWNPIVSLNSEDLKPYSNLEELVMSGIRGAYIAPDFLAPVQKLEVLIMSQTELDDPVLELPASLKILYAGRVTSIRSSAINLDLTKLSNLEDLSLASNEIQTFPTLHSKAPLFRLNLEDNPLTDMDYFKLAPFCKLQFLIVDKFASGAQYADKCCGVRLWADEFEIFSDLQCDKECVKEKNQFDSEALEIRRQCLVNESGGLWGYAIWILNISVGVILILAFVFLVFKHYRSAAAKAERRAKKMLEEGELEEEPQEFEEEKIS